MTNSTTMKCIRYMLVAKYTGEMGVPESFIRNEPNVGPTAIPVNRKAWISDNIRVREKGGVQSMIYAVDDADAAALPIIDEC